MGIITSTYNSIFFKKVDEEPKNKLQSNGKK